MINLCSATTIQHWFSKFYRLFETFCKFRVFVFRYRVTNENEELKENKIWVIFHWENLWKGIRIGSGIILRLFYQWRKEIMIFCGFPLFREFRGIDLVGSFIIFSVLYVLWIGILTSIFPWKVNLISERIFWFCWHQKKLEFWSVQAHKSHNQVNDVTNQ